MKVWQSFKLDQSAANGSTAGAIIVDGVGFALGGEPPVCNHYFHYEQKKV